MIFVVPLFHFILRHSLLPIAFFLYLHFALRSRCDHPVVRSIDQEIKRHRSLLVSAKPKKMPAFGKKGTSKEQSFTHHHHHLASSLYPPGRTGRPKFRVSFFARPNRALKSFVVCGLILLCSLSLASYRITRTHIPQGKELRLKKRCRRWRDGHKQN